MKTDPVEPKTVRRKRPAARPAPGHLSDDVRAAWRDMVKALGPHAASASPVGLEACAGQLARMRDAARRVEAEGEVVMDGRDRPVPHPALAVEFAAQAAVRQWLVVLTPKTPAVAAANEGQAGGADSPGTATSPLDELAARRAR